MNTITRVKKFVLVNPGFVVGVVALIFSGGALQAGDPAGAALVPVLKPVPKSVFIIPTSSADGRDPFFPNSTRAPGSAQPDRPAHVDAIPSPFVLNGVNMLPGSRTAIINGRTIAEGETANIPTATGDVAVHLLEFKNNAVVIQFGSQTNELHMRNE